jgi:hypothetical protein
MFRTLPRLCIGIAIPVCAATLLGIGGVTAQAAQDPIGPDQSFSGVVNGATANAAVRVACGGPGFPGETGHLLPGQYAEVTAPTARFPDIGLTGTAGTAVTVVLTVTAPSGQPETISLGTITSYDTPLPLSPGTIVPCSGTAEVDFVPAPPNQGAFPADVTATLVTLP